MGKNNAEAVLPSAVSQSRVMKYFWIFLGSLSALVGTVGIFLPIVPTVPFYLLTLFCYTKGSVRLRQWFVHTSLYQEHVALFVEERALTVRSKVLAIISLTIMIGVGAYFMTTWLLRLLLGAVWLVHVVWLLFMVKTWRLPKNQ